MNRLIGREKQVKDLNRALVSDKSELVVIYGRRRVGKTFLIRETYKKQIVFEVAGIPDGSYKEQLINFFNELRAIPGNPCSLEGVNLCPHICICLCFIFSCCNCL